MYRLMQDINTNDETSYKRNTESLLQELKRTTANVDVIKQLLKLTFAQRRKEIMKCVMSATSLIEQFSFFKIKKWVNFR